MRSAIILAAALVGLTVASSAFARSVSLLAPDNPRNSSGWRPPPSPTAGLKSFAPVETKDWLELNRDITPTAGDSMSMGGMKGMKGMGGMKGMDSMPGMGASKPGAGKESKGGMSGMPGMGGGK